MTHEQDVLFMTYPSEFFSLYAGSETADVYELDPLICPRCGSEMKLIAVITNPSEAAKILRHLIKIGRAPPGLDPSSLN
jgi:hypothetical protein